jgi:hypothetical protein
MYHDKSVIDVEYGGRHLEWRLANVDGLGSVEMDRWVTQGALDNLVL